MTSLQYFVVYGVIALLAATTFAYLAAISVMLSKIRNNHVTTFRALGEPSLFANNTISNGARVVRFLFSREYKNLSDPEVDRIGGVCRTLLIGIPVLLACAVAVALVYGNVARP